MEMRHQIEEKLRKLKMPGALQALETRLSEARENEMGHLEFLSLLLADELSHRDASGLAKRLKAAGFAGEKTFEGFDFRFNQEALPPAFLRDLASCHFLEQKQSVVIGGPPGIGKSHIAKAIGHEACRRGYEVLFTTTQKLLSQCLTASPERSQRLLRHAVRVPLLILDDFAFRKVDAREAELLYVLADERIGKASTVLTSNRPPEDWYATFPDPVVGGAILDRMVSAAIKLITTKGRSYRKEVLGLRERNRAKPADKGS